MRSVVFCAALMSLTACGWSDAAEGDQVEAPAPSPATASATAEPPAEGPASEPGDLGNGVTAEVVSVDVASAEDWVAEDVPGHDTWVTVQVRLSAEQETPITVDEMGGTGVRGELLYGPNLTPANSWASGQEAPTRITPDAPVTLVDEFSLPADGLEELRLVYSYDETSQAWTFTDVENLVG